MATRDQVENITYKLLEPILNEHQFECVDVEYIKEAGHWYLRVFLDKPGGINIGDCEVVSRALETELDKKDPIKEAYILEVSSPGLDRPLKKDKDFDRHMGDLVDIKLYKAVNKVKEFTGNLKGYTEESVTIDVDGDVLEFSRKDIAIIRLAVVF